MNIPQNYITSLGYQVIEIFRKIDLLIDVYESQSKKSGEIDLYSVDFDKVNRKLNPKYNLCNDTYRGFRIIRKLKPRRHNKRKLEVFNFESK